MKNCIYVLLLCIIIIIIYLIDIILYTEEISDVISYNDLIKQLKKGDILFSHGTNILSYLISFINNSHFSHVMMATDTENIIQNIPVKLFNIKDKNDVDIYSLKKFIKSGYLNKLYYMPISDKFDRHIDFDNVLNHKYTFSIYSADNNIFHNCTSIIAKIIKNNICDKINKSHQYIPKKLLKNIKESTLLYDKIYEVDIEKYTYRNIYTKLKNFFILYDTQKIQI